MSKINTFWNLISNYKIEIPVIQRDYAQGRIEERVNAIRIDFIKDLVKAISDVENKNVHLGFIYGKIYGKDKAIEKDRNQKAITDILKAVKGYAKFLELEIETKVNQTITNHVEFEDTPVFIPLDGQQRLTTLFLLHWYLIQFLDGQNYLKYSNHLRKFGYKVRKTSSSFCEKLCDNKIEIVNKDVSKQIINTTWFLKIWNRDPTVKGMLVTLDEIHNQLNSIEDKQSLFYNLINNDQPQVSFDFFDLDELNQTDELYVKMNARGKQLSDFEHFKAWLQNYIAINKKEFSKPIDSNWKIKVDKTWLDLFWRNSSDFSVDDTIFNAFKQIALLEYIALEEKPRVDIIKLIRDKKYISFKKFEEVKFFNEHTLNIIFKSLDILSNKNLKGILDKISHIGCSPFIADTSNLGKYFIQTDDNVSMPETVYFYALLLYICDDAFDAENYDEEPLRIWMRVTRNLIFNTYIQNSQNFIDSIKSIKKLSENKFDIKSFLINQSDNPIVEFFEKRQVKQETLKLKLIDYYDQNFFKQVIELENHEYFNGDIGFIIAMASNQSLSDSIDIDPIINSDGFLTKFENYGKKVSILFNKSIREHKEYILHRALLCKGDYFPNSGANYSFCLSNANSLRARRDNWQKLFNDEEKIQYLKQLIDEDIIDKHQVENKLIRLIQTTDTGDWRQYFINCYATFKFCERGLIRFNSPESILLLKTSRIYGSHAELRSYYYYRKYFCLEREVPSIKKNRHNLGCNNDSVQLTIEPFTTVNYWKNKQSKYDFTCIRLEGWKFGNQEYILEITFKDRLYYIRFYEKSQDEICGEIINSPNFSEWDNQNYYYFRTFQTIKDMHRYFVQLLLELKINV